MPIANKDPAMLGRSGFDRIGRDAYYTPDWCTKALIYNVNFRGPIWEPAAGPGRMAEILRNGGYDVVESDIDEKVNGVDFMNCHAMRDNSVSIVTNPPYLISDSFINHALALGMAAGGMVAMLLRHEYDCAKKRRSMFERPEFYMKLTLTKRPQWFEDKIASPRHNFAWYVWDALHRGPAALKWAS